MVQFKADDLCPVLLEARENACALILVKDQGVYLMSETGEFEGGRRKNLSYAEGMNPNIDDFDAWWNRSREELGVDDFFKWLDATSPMFDQVLEEHCDLIIHLNRTQLSLETARQLLGD